MTSKPIKTKDTANVEEKKKGISSIFRRETVGKTDYHFEGSIDIENLRFWAMHPEIGMSVVSTATANALRIIDQPLNATSCKEMGDLTELGKLGELGNFKTPTSMQENGVFGFRLNENKAKAAIIAMINRLASLRIRRGGGAIGSIKELKMQLVYITKTADGLVETSKTDMTCEAAKLELETDCRLYSHWVHTPQMLLKDEFAKTITKDELAKTIKKEDAAKKVFETDKNEQPTYGLAYINFSGTLDGNGVLNYVMARESTYRNSDGETKDTTVAAARTTREGFAKISSNCLRHEIFKAYEPVNVRGRIEERPSFVKSLSNLSGLFRGFCYMDTAGSAIKHTGFTITDAVSNEIPTEEFFSSSGPRTN